MRSFYYLIIVATLFIGSCQKEYSLEPYHNSQGGNNPSDTGTYFPTTAGTTWTYQVTTSFHPDTTLFNHMLDSLGVDSIEGPAAVAFLDSIYLVSGLPDTSFQQIITCSGQDTTIEHVSYTTLQSNIGESYVNKNNGNYNFIGMMGGPGVGSLSLLMLKDNQPVGTTWSDSTIVSGFPAVFNFSIKGKGLSIVVNGVTYKNVIEVEYTVPIPVPFVTGVATTVDMYYGLDVGVIESVMQPSVTGDSESIILTSVSVK
jgi:hypothetical protein